ncbi:hypothetical protein PQE68_gp009 [Bacillus phage vB_BanS_Sophrita]|uniref:Uncharacterized protein n=1 Tax=Bacillus phage vB_BanS_Sophrita TaxID=2894790 RepID=A0AAE8YTQ7_9CAUD|nr:hypothetical protein PQE68_gp009 [Bacillus phage vB_BanS_Sophrita]UGO50600.1 hypothetical protein SOPHRITA_9 [Bacillus phage vB_BanS_Sophrita]
MLKFIKRLFVKESKQDVYMRKINTVLQLCDELDLKIKK